MRAQHKNTTKQLNNCSPPKVLQAQAAGPPELVPHHVDSPPPRSGSSLSLAQLHPPDVRDMTTELLRILPALLSDLHDFLLEHLSLFDFSNVRVLADGRLDRLSEEWRSALNSESSSSSSPRRILDAFADRGEEGEGVVLPADFVSRRRHLLQRVRRLVRTASLGSSTEETRKRWMTPKKGLEVEAVSRLVAEQCGRLGLGSVMDVGCGMLHLGRALGSADPPLRVVAVEADAGLCSRASRLLLRDGKGGGGGLAAANNVTLVRSRVSAEGEELPSEVSEALQSEGEACLVGLHCCGDLSASLLRIFAGNPRLRAAVLLPCCYHKTTLSCNRLMSSYEGSTTLRGDLLCLPALRLACQEPLERWVAMTEGELTERARWQGYRAILEDFCAKRSLAISKRRRRGARKAAIQHEQDYVESVVEGYHFRRSDGGQEEIDLVWLRTELRDAFRDAESVLPSLLNLNIVQLSLQSLLEYFILLDRCLFVLERGFEVEIIELFDPLLSPRNKCILCY